MKSAYKRLGNYIQLVDNRNNDLSIELLLGLSISKEFIPSVANIIDTDMANYKIIRKNQFACSIMQVRRDKKMPIALLRDFDAAIISQAYPVFEIIDKNELLPEYLMMWVSRAEFDRHACFLAVGGVRGSLEWGDFCDMLLPVPDIKIQGEIVKEYQSIINRIKLKEQLNQKLEETTQVLYKRWFVDFEFPDENGKPYKSNGGQMAWSEELKQNIPYEWHAKKLGTVVESFSKRHGFKKDQLIFFNTSDILNGEFLHYNYSKVSEMPGQAKKSIRKHDILYSEIRPGNKRFALVRIDAEDFVVSTKLMVLRKKCDTISVDRLYHYLTYERFLSDLQSSAEGKSGTFPQITFEEDIENKHLVYGSDIIENIWELFLNAYYSNLFSNKDEIRLLKRASDLLLSSLVNEMELV